MSQVKSENGRRMPIAQGSYITVQWLEVEPEIFRSQVHHHNHYIITPLLVFACRHTGMLKRTVSYLRQKCNALQVSTCWHIKFHALQRSFTQLQYEMHKAHIP